MGVNSRRIKEIKEQRKAGSLCKMSTRVLLLSRKEKRLRSRDMISETHISFPFKEIRNEVKNKHIPYEYTQEERFLIGIEKANILLKKYTDTLW